MPTPAALLIQLAEHAAMQRWFNEGNRRPPGKPCEFFERLPEEQKAILRELKSDDLAPPKGPRFDAIAPYL